MPFVLASASPRRRRLMATFPFPVHVRPGRVKEPRWKRGVRPSVWVKRLALLKAAPAAAAVSEGLILGADTLVFRRGRVFGKPSSVAAARRMLAELAGRWHTVYTGLALLARPGRKHWECVWSTRVKMRALSPERLRYWSQRNHDKAGAYAAQEKGSPFVEKLRGDYDNVVGLPRRGLRRLLAKARSAGYAPSRSAGRSRKGI
ncbi:MAG TPA: Maf family protein [Elusimicrobiota bacterium]|nr:Maf family protein [Elusimicrobiota bacterium]